MENTFQYHFTVLPSMTDHNARLSLEAMLNLFMDTATMHASLLKVGAADILPRGLFWLSPSSLMTASVASQPGFVTDTPGSHGPSRTLEFTMTSLKTCSSSTVSAEYIFSQLCQSHRHLTSTDFWSMS